MTVEAGAARSRSTTPVYPWDVSSVYDLFYQGRGKDFREEARAVAEVVTRYRPGARSMLDVACGTGEHLRCLADHFPDVAGLELSAAMCDIARGKQPGGPVHQADMRDFDLSRTFDAVCCLTSTLGYMADTGELAAAVTAMAAHLSPSGVLVVDPWWTPEQFLDDHISQDLVRVDGVAVARMSHSRRSGHRVRNEAHYVVADEHGIRHFTHAQALSLFTAEQYLDAISRVGLGAFHLAHPAFPDRGLFVGVRP